jgi:hypothetical protein
MPDKVASMHTTPSVSLLLLLLDVAFHLSFVFSLDRHYRANVGAESRQANHNQAVSRLGIFQRRPHSNGK